MEKKLKYMGRLTERRYKTERVWVVYDVMGEGVSQVVPQAPTLSHTQFLRVCLYMMTLDLGPWHMSEITLHRLRCISWGQDLTHIQTHTAWVSEAEDESTLLLLVIHPYTDRLYPDNEDDRLCVPRNVYLPPSSYRLPQPPTCACTHTSEYTHKVVSKAHL